MIILNEDSQAIIIDSITTPLTTDYFWVLDLDMMDYTVVPLMVLQEIVSPTATLRIFDFDFEIPTTWCMLVYDEDTMQLDVVDVEKLAGKEFTALVYGTNKTMVVPGEIRMMDYTPEGVSYSPFFGKGQMLCHPIGPDEWVNIAPSDLYNKYLKGTMVGDIIS